MKKFVTIIGLLIVISVGVLFYFKTYYPALPVDSVSKREAVKKANTATEILVKLTEENGYEWYISKMNQGATGEQLKQMMIERGWIYKDQMGSGLFFQKENEALIIESKMWTSKYVISRIPISE